MLVILLQNAYHIKSRGTFASYWAGPMFKSMHRHRDGNQDYVMRGSLLSALEAKPNGIVENLEVWLFGDGPCDPAGFSDKCVS